MSEQLNSVFWIVSTVACVLAYGACLVSNWKDRREGYPADAPTGMTGSMAVLALVLVIAVAVPVYANDSVNPCSLLDGDSWTDWAMWLANSCWLYP